MPLTQEGLLLAGIVDALSSMKEIKGSTTKTIVNYIRSNPHPDMSKRVITEITIQKAIERAVENKILRQNAGRFLINFEGMTSLANVAMSSIVGGRKSGSCALSRHTGPADRAIKMACTHKKHHRKSKRGCRSSRKRRGCKKSTRRKRSCKKRRHRSRSCKKRSRRSRSCKKRSRRKSSCKKRSRRKSGCKKRSRRKSSCKKRSRRSRSCKKSRRRRSRSCKKSRRRRKSSCKKRSRRKSSCKKRSRRKSRKCRNEDEEEDAMAPEAPIPMRDAALVKKKDSTATLVSIPSMTSTTTKKSDDSLMMYGLRIPSAQDDL